MCTKKKLGMMPRMASAPGRGRGSQKIFSENVKKGIDKLVFIVYNKVTKERKEVRKMSEYYMVNVEISGVGRETSRIEHIKFKSLYAARHMAKQYFECEDVQSVEVINATTGEVMYFHDYRDEYDAEG